MLIELLHLFRACFYRLNRLIAPKKIAGKIADPLLLPRKQAASRLQKCGFAASLPLYDISILTFSRFVDPFSSHIGKLALANRSETRYGNQYITSFLVMSIA